MSGKDSARRAESRIVSKADYEKHLARLQTELVRMQEWVVHEGLRVMVEMASVLQVTSTASRAGSVLAK